MIHMSRFNKTIVTIQMILEDSTTPRMVREKLTNMVAILKDESEDDSSTIENALRDIDDMSSDVNIPPYVRTQLYAISSQLEAND